jgi:hypothetical protein
MKASTVLSKRQPTPTVLSKAQSIQGMMPTSAPKVITAQQVPQLRLLAPQVLMPTKNIKKFVFPALKATTVLLEQLRRQFALLEASACKIQAIISRAQLVSSCVTLVLPPV